MQQREPVGRRAQGQWPGILAAIGVPAKALRNRHGPCPMCGGKDRFRFDDKEGKGTWYCNRCGAGDGVELVKRFRNLEFREAAREIERHLGSGVPAVVAANGAAAPLPANTDELRAMWGRGAAITTLDPAGRYLLRRTGLQSAPDCLRFAKDERYADQGARPSWHPVMLAKVDPCDEAVAAGEKPALHRTYLTKDGHKADVPTPRKALGTMPTGAAVRLMKNDTALGIAEGIETALSAAELFAVPTWAALNAGLLETWSPPAAVSTVFVFGDNDRNYVGQAAAYALAKRLALKGLSVFVEIPQSVGEDWNDVWTRREGRTLDTVRTMTADNDVCGSF